MKRVIPAGILVVLGLLGLRSYARPAYERHREVLAVEQPNSYLAEGDYREASLSARQTLRADLRPIAAPQCGLPATAWGGGPTGAAGEHHAGSAAEATRS